MKAKRIALCIIIVLIFLSPSAVIKNEGHSSSISALPEPISSMTIFDIRSADEYDEGHIKGAISLPISKILCGSCMDSVLDMYSGNKIKIYCGDNEKAGEIALKALQQKNINASILSGNIKELEEKGFPIVYSEPEEKVYYTGCIPMNKTEVTEKNLSLPSPVPTSWDWRDVNGENWVTPVKNQGSCGSCWDFAAMGALESVIKIDENNSNFNPDLSEQYLLSCPPDSGGCNGWNAYYAYKYIAENGGALTEDCFMYKASDSIPCSSKCPNWEENLVPITDYGITYTPSRDYIKSALIKYGPLVVEMTAYKDFSSYKGGIYEHDGNEPVGDINHQVVLIGYNDEPGYWICKNSWGEHWGENGFFRIAYGDCQIEHSIIYVSYDPESKNWAPVADAGGPYSGKVSEPITFDGSGSYDVDGNIASYSWNFGDGTTGEGMRTTHQYSHEGKFTVRLTVTDTEGKFNVSETVVYVDETPPIVKIAKPKDRYLYFNDAEVISLLFKTRIIGGITIGAYAHDNISEINKVEFYIDDKLMETVYDMPFSWKWEDASPFTHTIKVVAYDSAGNSASDEREVWTIM